MAIPGTTITAIAYHVEAPRQCCAGTNHASGAAFGHTVTAYTTVTHDDGRRFHYCPEAWEAAAPGVIAAMRAELTPTSRRPIFTVRGPGGRVLTQTQHLAVAQSVWRHGYPPITQDGIEIIVEPDPEA